MNKPENIPGNDSIRPGQKIGTVAFVGRGRPKFEFDDTAKPVNIQPITMSNAEAIDILKHLETDIYGRIAIAKAIDALKNDVQELQDLINTYPLGCEEMRIFAEWHESIGATGDSLRRYLQRLKDDSPKCTYVAYKKVIWFGKLQGYKPHCASCGKQIPDDSAHFCCWCGYKFIHVERMPEAMHE